MEKHWQLNFDILTNFSEALISKEYFEEIIELLEAKLAIIENKALKDPNIGNCYYNLGLANYSKMKYQLAKKYYLNALKYLPNDQETLTELFKICVAENDIKNAANIINKLQASDLKNVLEMSIDLRKVTIAKLKSVNKNLLHKDLRCLILNLEYIAKFNENKFSDSDKVSAFKNLMKSCDSYNELFSALPKKG
ncbi:MAG TPA: hypothetical protein LFW21_02715 [Rickettsia endosymbiont of Pyrocoelia pectoralis]|nr:hypothetical protein [Rickettsia endosymbiont of Pyrocoelia pectoralis]